MIRRFSVTVAGKARAVEIEDLDGRARVAVDGKERTLEVREANGGLTWFDGTRVVHAVVDRGTVSLRGITVPVQIEDARSQALAAVARERPQAVGPLTVRSPIPGRVAKILVKLGEAVVAGRPLAVVEAMKMENEIRSPRAGIVKEIRCAEGANVEANQELVSLE